MASYYFTPINNQIDVIPNWFWKNYSTFHQQKGNQSTTTEFILLAFGNFLELRIVLFILFLPVYTLSIAGNLLIVSLVVIDQHLHTPMYFFLVNLSCLETCYTSTILPRMLASFITGDQSISVYGCIIQYYFFGFFAATECYLLAMMSYDRYLAICKPLHYNILMNGRLCLQLALISWMSGLLTNTIITAFLLELTFCGPYEVDHFFCDIYPVANISCSNTRLVKLATFILGIMGTGPPFLITGKIKVRISKSLSVGEEVAITARKKKVEKALAKLGMQCDSENIPSIAILGAGGAMRAMIALYGTLVELKKYNLLDCVMCLPTLYKNEDWSEEIENLSKCQFENLVQGQWDFNKAMKAVLEATEDECYSLTDFWSYFLVHKLLSKFEEEKLSEHAGSCESGKNPYPIYAAVNKQTYENQNAGTWFEFTPHEIGIPELGAYVESKYFGSIFQNGQLIREKREKNICYLQDALKDFGKYVRLEDLISKDSDKEGLDKLDHLENILKDYGSSKSYQLTREMHETWYSADEQRKKEKYMTLFQTLDADFGADVEFPELTNNPIISLIDAGLTINTAYPSVLRPERQVKLILSFDFSAGDPFLTIKKAAEYCEAHAIPFPKVDENALQDLDTPSDCYIFRGEYTPTIIHCPLFNKINCPGEIAEYREQFSTFKLSYSAEEIEKLLIAAKKNVANVQQKVLEEIKHIVGSSS
ncbi:Olfactory receptor 10A7, partial [Ophiophagus hannah]